MGRSPCCDKNGLKRGPWTPEEDQRLIDYIQKHGYGNWRTLPKNAELQRCGKSCRLRWTNYLRPDIKRGRFSFEEEETIIQLHSVLGNKWSAIAARLPGRTDNEIKNYWNTHIRKRLLRMGIDPVTHAPRLDLLDIYSSSHHMTNHFPSHLLRAIPSINPELLKIATSLRPSLSENQEYPFQQIHASNLQFQELYYPTSLQESQFVNSAVPFLDGPQPVQPASSGLIPLASYNCIYGSGHPTLDTSSENPRSKFDSKNKSYLENFNYGPAVYSTPSSSPAPLHSNSTYINSGTEDDREISCCSNYNLMRYEIPELLDVSELI